MRSAKLKLKPLDEKNGRLGKHGRLGMSGDVESSYAMDRGCFQIPRVFRV